MLWHEQTWPAIGRLDRDLPVVIPLGSCEQHGHHLPLLVDTIQVSAVAERVEQVLGDRILLTPTLWLGCSHHHRDFPGTISLRPSLYGELISSMARSVMGAGFKRIFFLNGHGGNEIPASGALTELVAEDDDADAAWLAFASWWSVGRHAIAPAAHGMTTPFVTHACEYETSMMLFLRPDLVDQARAVDSRGVLDSAWWDSEYDGRVGVYRRFHRLTAVGSMGKPRAGTAEKGRSMLEAVVKEVVAFLTEFATWPDLPRLGPH